LTEEDLQLLNTYVIEKNRLHNRYLFGDGVVCGLEVVEQPCDSRKVIVKPGYALDCCGNDIVVPCPIELDINPLIRDLRTRLRGGYDCGDPCPPQTNGCKSATATDPATATNPATAATDDSKDKDKKPPPPCFCLYIRYDEKSSDPVMPYPTEDSCSLPSCFASRVREGYRFELDCCAHQDPPSNLVSQFIGCVGDPEALKSVPATYAELNVTLKRMIKHRELRDLQLHELKQNFHDSAEEISADAKEEIFLNVLSYGAHLLSAPRTPKPSSSERDYLVGLCRHLDAAAGILGKRNDELADCARVLSSIAAASTSRQPAKSKVNLDELHLCGSGTTRANLLRKIEACRSVLGNLSAVPKTNSQPALMSEIVSAQKKVIQLEGTVHHVDSSQVQGLNPVVENGVSAHRAGESLLFRLLRSCLCSALLPTCQPCADPRVLLACFEWEECQVKNICNLKRKIIPSPAAVRYWTPPDFGAALEILCCSHLHKCDCKKDEEGQTDRSLASILQCMFGIPDHPRSAEDALEQFLHTLARKGGELSDLLSLLSKLNSPRTATVTSASVSGALAAGGGRQP
jgi:hypothetical protein